MCKELNVSCGTFDARSSQIRERHNLEGAANAFGRFAPDPVTAASVGSWRVPIFVVEPTVDVVGLGASVGQLGLVNIMVDYGYMRAFDTIVPLLLFPEDGHRVDRAQMFDELSRSSDKIVALRLTSWDWEHHVNGYRSSPLGPTNHVGTSGLLSLPEQSAIAEVRTTKARRRRVADRLAITGRYESLAAPRVPPGTIMTPACRKPVRGDVGAGMGEARLRPDRRPVPADAAMPDGDPWMSLTYAGQWTEPAGARPAPIWAP